MKKVQSVYKLSSFFVGNLVRNRVFIAVGIIFLGSLLFTLFLPLWFVAILGVVFLYLAIQKEMDEPMRNLLQVARRGGDEPVLITGHDDFSRLARMVSSMASRMHKSLRESHEQRERLNAIFSAIGEGVIITDNSFELVKMNQTARDWLKIDSSSKNLRGVFSSTQLLGALQELSGAPVHTEKIIEVMEIGTSSEGRRVRTKIVLVDMAGTPGFMIFLFDLTDLYRVQEMRREFFANVSHELKTPMAAIRGYAETLHDHEYIRKDDLSHNFLGVILRNTEQLASLVDQMLGLAKLESGAVIMEKKHTEIRPMIKRVVETLLPKASAADVAIQIEIKEGMDTIFADSRFESVLLNLIDNGIKYNRPDGYVNVRFSEDPRFTILHVQDTGIGIPQTSQARAFERFYRVDKSHNRLGGGSGLGLAIVKHIVQAHGGTISLTSEPSVGSTFIVTIPRN